MDHWWGFFKNPCPPTLGEGFLGRRPWRKDGLAGMPEAAGYFAAASCRRFSAAALRPTHRFFGLGWLGDAGEELCV